MSDRPIHETLRSIKGHLQEFQQVAQEKLAEFDGRHRRVERSKQAALAACREMMMHGVFQPTAANVAARAKLSVRTVFDHFGCVEALRLEAIRDGVVRDAIIARVLGEAWANDGGPEEWFDRIARAVVLGRA